MLEPTLQDIEKIYHTALEKEPGGERSAFIAAACEENPELQAKVEALLETNEEVGDFLAASPIAGDITLEASPLTEEPGTIIGRYKLLERIGEGGFGVVWAAQQKDPVKRRVALKIIKLGMDTRQVVARFEAERQALALMDHPNIAKVLDGGSTEAGRPYFVMELVKGIPIIEYCDQGKLSIQERLDLFIKVCHAIQHAHQKGIIHRDIKPSNILITLHDGVPVPRVIDFGIAKATQQELTEKTIYTQHHQFIGTPVYMSPEQAEMSGLDIDTRSDIYSLGVLLYELLTGKTPFDERELLHSGFDEMRKIIREQEPVKPSTRLSQLLSQSGASSKLATRHSSLATDLDWIVMKCLEKDRTRRYDTANGLALDVARHLSNEPVIARPPTTVYQLQKAWRRNRVVYAAAGLVVASLILGLSMSLWQAAKATRAERQSSANAILAQQNSQLAEQRAIEARKSESDALRRAYNSDMSLAFRALEENLFGRVQESVNQHVPEPGEQDFRGWEWRYAWGQSQSEAVLTWATPAEIDAVVAVRISPDQRYMVSSDIQAGSRYVGHARRLWDFQTRTELNRINLPFGSPRGFAFSNSGSYLALHRSIRGGSNEIHIYDTTTWALESLLHPERYVHALAFSPDDTRLATIGPPLAVLWDWRRQAKIYQWPSHGARGHHHDDVVFFPDSNRLAVGDNSELKIIDTRTGDIEHSEPAPDGGITCLAVSPDSRFVAIGSGYEIHEIGVLNTTSWQREPPLTGHSFWVSSLMFSENGELLISSSADNTVRIWDMHRVAKARVLRGHQSEVFSFSLASDGSRAVSGGKDGHVLEWDLNVHPTPFREYQLSEPVREVVFSADSRSFYTTNEDGLVNVWDTNSLSKRHSSAQELGPLSSIILSVDGDELIAGTGSGELWVMDARDLQIVSHQSVQSGGILPVGFSQDNASLVLLESSNKISLWDAEDWELRSRIQAGYPIQSLTPNYCAIPPDSDILLYPSGADLVWWDLQQTVEPGTLRVNQRMSGVIAISPTEPLLASAARGDFIFLWNWKTHQLVAKLRGPRAFNSVAFSPDGRRLVSGGNGKGSLMLWDVSTRQEIARLGTYVSQSLISVQFSPDGNMICAVDTIGTAHFWRAPSMERIDTILAHRGATDTP